MASNPPSLSGQTLFVCFKWEWKKRHTNYPHLTQPISVHHTNRHRQTPNAGHVNNAMYNYILDFSRIKWCVRSCGVSWWRHPFRVRAQVHVATIWPEGGAVILRQLRCVAKPASQ